MWWRVGVVKREGGPPCIERFTCVVFVKAVLMTVQFAPARPPRYWYKSHLLMAECNITEHVEGDQCKFALWTGRLPAIHEYRLVLRAATLELKQVRASH